MTSTLNHSFFLAKKGSIDWKNYFIGVILPSLYLLLLITGSEEVPLLLLVWLSSFEVSRIRLPPRECSVCTRSSARHQGRIVSSASLYYCRLSRRNHHYHHHHWILLIFIVIIIIIIDGINYWVFTYNFFLLNFFI